MRTLQTKDIFSAARMLNKIGIKEEIKAIAMKADSVKDIVRNKAEFGYDFLFAVYEKVVNTTGEMAIYEFLSGIFEMSVEEIQCMDPVECLDEALKCADVEKWKSFFLRVAGLMK